ncbi:hypothetical protein BGX26_010566, partial [Mortierella sp. AD094]
PAEGIIQDPADKDTQPSNSPPITKTIGTAESTPTSQGGAQTTFQDAAEGIIQSPSDKDTTNPH